MAKIKYMEREIRKSGHDLIAKVNAIIDKYRAQGYGLTLRQVYYQLVTMNAIENSEASYKRIGELINTGRLTGLIDWEAIEDRTRYIRGGNHWGDPGAFLLDAAGQYKIDLWEDQREYVEVWVEKDALIGIVEQVAGRYDVPCFSCRGYVSQSEMWQAAQRIIDKGKPATILHLGDHDPSGLDMTRDIRERLELFDAAAQVERIALNMAQVEQYDIPPNPAKTTDARSAGYIRQYGNESWELDALEPSVITNIITGGILKRVDAELYNARHRQQEEQRSGIRILAYGQR